MIKKLNENINSIDYFDGAIIPQYKSINIPQNESLYDLLMVESIMKDFDCICGYITNEKLHYYDLRSTGFNVDFHKDEVVLLVWNHEFDEIVQQHTVFNFISSICRKLWFVTSEGYLCIEKTPESYRICKQLNKIFEDFTFNRIFMDLVIKNERENTLFDLMDVFNAFYSKPFTAEHPNWKDNYENIMKDWLKLKVTRSDY